VQERIAREDAKIERKRATHTTVAADEHEHDSSRAGAETKTNETNESGCLSGGGGESGRWGRVVAVMKAGSGSEVEVEMETEMEQGQQQGKHDALAPLPADPLAAPRFRYTNRQSESGDCVAPHSAMATAPGALSHREQTATTGFGCWERAAYAAYQPLQPTQWELIRSFYGYPPLPVCMCAHTRV
jgi:hypothetical protein